MTAVLHNGSPYTTLTETFPHCVVTSLPDTTQVAHLRAIIGAIDQWCWERFGATAAAECCILQPRGGSLGFWFDPTNDWARAVNSAFQAHYFFRDPGAALEFKLRWV